MTPPPPGGGGAGEVLEGDEARDALAESARRTIARRTLAANPRFDQLSPEVGVLDEDALASMMDEDPDAALALLADLTGATDEMLRRRALDAARRVIVERLRSEIGHGIGGLVTRSARVADGDVDVDASLDAIVEARSRRRPVALDDLAVSAWERRDVSVCLVVDRSGSMTGERLAAAAVSAAAVALRHPASSAVVAFSERAIVVRSMGSVEPPGDAATDLLRLRGHGPTDVGLALRAASAQVAVSGAARRIVVLLSDCRWTAGDDPTPTAAALAAELVVMAPADDSADAARLAASTGARLVALAGPADAARALNEALALR